MEVPLCSFRFLHNGFPFPHRFVTWSPPGQQSLHVAGNSRDGRDTVAQESSAVDAACAEPFQFSAKKALLFPIVSPSVPVFRSLFRNFVYTFYLQDVFRLLLIPTVENGPSLCQHDAEP
jgi:hypothetical protein